MPYAPGIQNRSGEYIAQGFSQGINSIAQAMVSNAQKREEREREKKMTAYLEPLVQQMSGGKVSMKDAPREVIPTLYAYAQEMEKEKQLAPQRALEGQLNAERLRSAQLSNKLAELTGQSVATNQSAARSAFGSPVPADQRLNAYLAGGGTDPAMIEQLNRLAKADNPRSPQLLSLGQNPDGSPIQVIWDGNNAQQPRTTPAKPAPYNQPLYSQDNSMYRGGPDQPWRPVRGGNAPDPMAPSYREQLAKLTTELFQHQQAMDNGDNRMGFMNFESRKARVEELQRKIAGYQALLGRGAGPTNVAPAPAATPEIDWNKINLGPLK